MSTEFEFDPTANENIDPSTIETNGPQYPVMQWHYGDRKMKQLGGMAYQGGWFVKADQADEATMLAAGWTKVTWTHDSGSEDEGFWKREIAVSTIATRKRWEVTGADGSKAVFPWSQYEAAKATGSPRGRLHVLCIVKGLESIGPMVLTLKGSASVGFEGSRNSNGALVYFAQTVIRKANAESAAAAKKVNKAAKPWPYRAFWLPVGADRDEKGEPRFVEMGKGKDSTFLVLPVALGLPPKAEQVDLKRFYVGNEMLAQVNDILSANTEWVTAWENIVPGATENGMTVAPEAEAQPNSVSDAELAAAGL